LQYHIDHRAQQINALLVDKDGPKLTESPDEGIAQVIGMHTTHRTMYDLASLLTFYMRDRTVVDMTGIEGEYDLDYGPDVSLALKKVGLKLEKRAGTVDYLIIDSAQRKPIAD
jgi:uncharacterized protein (TIGR03435 family)